MTGGLGLDRYDGHRFEHYSANSGQLLSNNFVSISEGPEGKIWLGELGGTRNIQIFDPVKKHSSWWWQELDTTALKGEPVHFILGDLAEPAVWLVTTHGVLRYGKDKVLKETFYSQGLIREAMASHGGIWIYTGGDFKLVGHQGLVQRAFKVSPEEYFVMEGVDSQDNIYYRQRDAFDDSDRYRKFRNDQPFRFGEVAPWDSYTFLSVNPYKDQILASDLSTNEMVILDTTLQELTRFKPDPHFYKFPPQFYWDHLGNGWTQFNEAVHVFHLEPFRFQNHLTNIITFGELGVGSRGIHIENDSTIYVSSLGGTFLLNPKTGEYERFWSKPGKMEVADLLGLRQLAILKTSDGKIYFSNEGGRINYYEPQTQSYDTIFPAADTPMLNNLFMNWVLHEDRAGNIWIGRNNGLAKIIKDSNIYSPFLGYNNFTELANTTVYDMHQTNDTTLWVASEKGLYRLHPEKGIVEKRTMEGVASSDVAILDINSFDDSSLFLATQNGLIHYNTANSTVVSVWNTENGLSNNICYAVYKDSFNRLWTPSNNGINLINPDGSIQVFKTEDGLIHNEFNRISHSQAPDGRLFFGSLNGVTEINPPDFPFNESTNTTVLLTNLRIQKASDGSYENFEQNLSDLNEINLYPSDLGLELQFSLLDYLDNQFRSFSYKIEGLDNDWTYLETPEVRINRLPYGEYQLLLRGQAPNGALTSEKAFKLRVHRPFYLQWWFFLLLALAVAVGVLALQRIRERKLKQRQRELEAKINQATEEIRKQAEELRSLDQLKSNFFANISHELKTPLSLILAPLGEALKSSEVNEVLKNNLSLAQRNAESIKNLVNEILDLTRLENGVAQPRYSKVQIDSFLQLLLENFKPKANAANIQLSYQSIAASTDTWVIDRNMTEKIINNLISNALRHTPANGSIQVVSTFGEELSISVTDTGSGITEEDLPYIFDRFFQTKDPNKKAEGGTGIGLALSNELAQVMNGHLEVESEVGLGSTFTLTLPEVDHYIPSKIKVEERSIVDDHPHLFQTKFNLLIVDDNDEIRNFIKSNLSAQFDVLSAQNGREALQLLADKSLSVHLIISDLMMPEMDGIELLERLKSDETTQNIPVIFLTARTAERDKIEAFRIGVDDYLTKPFSLDELKARIKNQLKIALQKKHISHQPEEEPEIEQSLSENELWLKRLRELTEREITAVDFSIGSLADKLGMSERTLFRKIKKLTGFSPNVYLREIRLQMARRILENKEKVNVGSVSQEIGFTSTKYFSKLYKERFGKSPSEYIN